MLEERAHSASFSGGILATVRSSLFFLAIASLLWGQWPGGFSPANYARAVSQLRAAPGSSSTDSLNHQHVTAAQLEQGELFNSANNLQLDPDPTVASFLFPVELTSSRIIPQGLVLSYLCDSARHQCSGVQLI